MPDVTAINGKVVASGTDTRFIGGVGAGTFDLGTLGAQYTGFSTFKKVDASTWIVTNTQTVTTPWTVSSGTLIVNGSIANSSLGRRSITAALSAAPDWSALRGQCRRQLSPRAIAANPTGTLTVAGNLTLQTGALYLVTVAGTSASKTDV